MESIFTLSESFPVPCIVHYVPFTVQKILILWTSDLFQPRLQCRGRALRILESIWLDRKFDGKMKYDVMSKKSLSRFGGSDELQALNAYIF